ERGEPAELFVDVREQADDLLLDGNVCSHRDRLAALAPNCGYDLVGGGAIPPVIDADRIAARSGENRGRGTDAPAGASDEQDLVHSREITGGVAWEDCSCATTMLGESS